MNRRAILVFLLAVSLAGMHAETRSAQIDFVILIDTSLSMADAMRDARQYAAGEVVGRLVETGDWVSIIRFYGSSEIVWRGDVASEADTAAMVRSLNALEADGRFTDIGAALDSMDALILERGHPERPKYILLITDERQEAPKGSEYYSADYSIHHPLLEYIKRLDMGSFRVITIGYGLAARIEGEARSLMTTLSEPPSRLPNPLAGDQSGMAPTGTAGGAQSSTPQDSMSSGGADGSVADATGTTAGEAASGGQDAASSAARPQAASSGFSGAPIAAGLAAAGSLGVIIAIVLARRRKRHEGEDKASTSERDA